MKTMILITSMFMGALASAHVEPGTYKGTALATGEPCEMIAGENFYLNGERHPLNERIKINYDGIEYIVQHPPVIDEATSTAHFNHDEFQGLFATKTGAKAFIIHMSHTEEFEGPVSFTAFEHVYKSGQRSSLTCANIKKQ